MNRKGEKVIGLASTSTRRALAIDQLPGVHIIKVSGGPEAPIDNLIAVAVSKIAFAVPTILEICQEHHHTLDGIAAADTNTYLGVLFQGQSRLVGKSKPQSNEAPYHYFKRMAQHAKKTGQGYYEVRSASAFQDQEGIFSSSVTTEVQLNPSLLAYLATQDGFNQYLELFNQFYNSKAYKQSGLKNLQPIDLSAGISLPVLTKMGAVEKIDGVDLKSSKPSTSDMAFKKALFNVAVGFSPQVLSHIHPDAMAYIMSWQWLNEVTEEAMGSNHGT